MPLGPVFRHEMLAAGRKRRYIVLRVVLGVFLLFLLAIAYEAARVRVGYFGDASVGEVGLSIAATSALAAQFFSSFAWLTMLAVIGLTPAIAAGAIATERERRTIEYLFATDLSNSEIVLDKLAARLLTVVQIALATLPLLAIFRLLGGVPGDLILIHFAQIVCAATMIAAISLAVSTWCERARDAVPRAYGVLLATLFAPVLLSGFAELLTRWGYTALGTWVVAPVAAGLALINPVWTLSIAGGAATGVLGVDLDLRTILISLAAQLGVAAVCMGVCVAAVRRVHLRASGSGDSTKANSPNARSRPAPFDNAPMFWKERYAATQRKRRRFGSRATAVVALIAFGIPTVWSLWEAMTLPRRDAWENYFQYAAVMVGFMAPIVLLLVGSRAAGAITHEKERDTWLSLLTTPLSARDIVLAKLLGNLWALRWPLAGVIAIPALGLLLRGDTLLAPVGVAAAVGATAWSASAIGLWNSLWMKSSVKAIGTTIAILIGIGGAYLPFVFMFAAAAGMYGEEMAILFAPCVPYLCVLPIVTQFDGPADSYTLYVAYFLGVGGYTALGFVTTMAAIERFDEMVERNTGAWRAPNATVDPIS